MKIPKKFRGTLKTLKRSMLVYKAARHPSSGEKVIVTLRIPAGARVVMFNGGAMSDRKCRASRARVVSIDSNTDLSYALSYFNSSNINLSYALSYFNSSFEYHVGEDVSPEFFSRATLDQCTGGIHFFRRIEDAEAY